jgi:hypothetical protein
VAAELIQAPATYLALWPPGWGMLEQFVWTKFNELVDRQLAAMVFA